MFASERAREILTFVLKARLVTDEQLERRVALTVLQSIGEGYALLSESWPIGLQDRPALPIKDNLSRIVRETGAGAWLAEKGYAVDLAAGQSIDGPVGRPPDEQEVAEIVSSGLREYARFVGNMESPPHRSEVLHNQAVRRRRLTCAQISSVRLMLDSLIPLGSRTERARVALALILTLHDSEFVALCSTSDEPLESVPLLRIGFVDGLLEESGVREWLTEFGYWPIPQD